MPIDPSKMDAFLNEAPPAPLDEEMEEETATEPAAPAEDRFDRLKPVLAEFLEDVTETVDEMDAGVLMDTEMPLEIDDYDILVDGMEGLDKRLQKEMKASLSGGITQEEADSIAQHFASVNLTEEPEKLAGWLFRCAESYAGPPSEEDEEEEDEEVEEDELDEEPPTPEALADEV